MPFKTNTWNHRDAPALLVLKLVGESTNWYAAEVNGKTKEIKYAPKNVPRMWARTSWEHWLFRSGTLKFDGQQTKVNDRPNGTPIDGLSSLDRSSGEVVKVDGEWAYITLSVNGKSYTGWIKWRNGRDLLVGFMLNDNKLTSDPQ